MASISKRQSFLLAFSLARTKNFDPTYSIATPHELQFFCGKNINCH